MNKLDVLICGDTITLKSRESKEHIFKLADYVNLKLRNLIAKSTTAAVDDRMRTILVALNIADDYFKTQGALENLQKKQRKQDLDTMELHNEIDSLKQERNNLLEEVQTLKDTIAKLEEKIESYEIEEEEEQSSILSMPSVLRKKPS